MDAIDEQQASGPGLLLLDITAADAATALAALHELNRVGLGRAPTDCGECLAKRA
ncbi:DUF6207 family protein [Streptomyces sp. NPDC060064]|uniref:DUF6207 family protein n=1 Tax=Streptomyces sp. NPDC060064 TaxID=3347049 RepID=UPI0036D1CCCF